MTTNPERFNKAPLPLGLPTLMSQVARGDRLCYGRTEVKGVPTGLKDGVIALAEDSEVEPTNVLYRPRRSA